MPPKTDRTWPLPNRPWAVRMTWSNLLFAHWPVDPTLLADSLPSDLTLDTRDGKAWIGVVPFLMSDVAPRCCPAIPKLSRFLELNVRTYVTRENKPGVWFFSLDAASRIAVRLARATFALPYMNASMKMNRNHENRIEYESTRTHRGEPESAFRATYQPVGESFHAEPGTLEYWLTARYCLYSADHLGRLYRAEIEHEPWSLFAATYVERVNTMCQSLEIDLVGSPHLLAAEPISVRGWLATLID